jgi:hypothetical protein
MLAAFFRERPHPRPPRIDYLASLLLMTGAGALMVAMLQGRNLSRTALALAIAVGLGSLAVLVRHERHAAAPMLPLRLWSNRVIAMGNLGSFGIGATMMSVTMFVPTYIQGVMGLSPAGTGAALAAMSISWAVASTAAGRTMLLTSFRTSAMIGGALLAAGSGILAAMTPLSGPVWAGAGALVVGLGMGSCNTTYLVSAQATAALRERGAATASNLFMRIVGQSTGAALFGALVNAGIARYAPHAEDVAARLMEPALRQQLAPAELAELTSALAAALGNVYLVGIALGLAVLFVGSRLPVRLNPATAQQAN